MEVVAVLERIRQNGRLSDTEFAASMEVSRQTWQRHKAGGAVTLRFLQLAYAAYPQTRPSIERLLFPANAKKAATKQDKTQRAKAS